MDVITTKIKREFFIEIVEKRKRIEYRELKPYWTKRLKSVQLPFKLVLRNGMWPPVPVVTVRIDKIAVDLRLIPVASLAVSSHGSLNLGELTDEEAIYRRTDHRDPEGGRGLGVIDQGGRPQARHHGSDVLPLA
jgi:hypothetical protein